MDSTRRGKRVPDSMSRTIPIWTCVLNRAIFNYLNRIRERGSGFDSVSNDNNACCGLNYQIQFVAILFCLFD